MKIGFIGCGNMGQAILKGLLAKGRDASDIIVADRNKKALDDLKSELRVDITVENRDAVKDADILILAVKPDILKNVLEEIKDDISKDTVILSIAAGKSLGYIHEAIGDDAKVVRVMPNAPALVGEGMSGFTADENVSDEDKKAVIDILSSFGEVEEVSESIMDIVTSVGGSAPAYVYMFIEALADAAVLDGMQRDKALKFAAQCVYGSAKMVKMSGKHPGELKDMVCSPGGTTIEGVRTLEDNGFRGIIIEAVHAATEKSKEL